MSIDDLRSIGTDSIETDLCLVGSGPAAWTIAEELRESGLRILMLESGGRELHPDATALNDIEDVGTRLWNGRARVLGGTSRLWNGRCVPFDDIDYEAKPWAPRTGWPFGAAAMAPHVDRASKHLGSGPYYDGAKRRALPAGLRPRPEIDPSLMLPMWWENPAYIDFGRVVTARRSVNLWVLLHATVTHLNTDAFGREIDSVEVADANGRRVVVHARVVVLCAGGIENARLLLYSNRAVSNGVGNAHDVVGRYLMDHPRDLRLATRVDDADADRFRDLFGPHLLDSPRGRHEYWYGYVLSPERVRSEKLLNAAAWSYAEIAEDDPVEAAKRLVKGPRGSIARDAKLVASQLGTTWKGLKPRLSGQKVRSKPAKIGFLVSSEQLPDPDSRVLLGERRDRFGLPVARVDWRVSELETRSQAALAQSIAAEFTRLGLPRIQLAPWVHSGRVEDAGFVDGCHPCGTTRMADDPRQGVVDADCQVHGVDGLFVAGSSVFPTAGHANPTLMIVALAVRLAEHLRLRLSTRTTPVRARSMPMLAAD